MDPVKPPEQRDEMERGMLKVDDEIEEQYSENDLQPVRKLEIAE